MLPQISPLPWLVMFFVVFFTFYSFLLVLSKICFSNFFNSPVLKYCVFFISW